MNVSIQKHPEIVRDEFYILSILDNFQEKNVGEFNLGLDSDDGNMWLCSISIKSEYRDNGYGKKSIHEIIKLGKFLGFPELRLIVDSDNEIAQHVYLKCGFEFLPQVDNFYCYEMKMKL